MKRLTAAKRQVFLQALRESGNVTRSAEEIGFNRDTLYRHRQKDPDFARAWQVADLEYWDTGLEEAKRRGWKGIHRPVIHKGELQYRKHPNGTYVKTEAGNYVPLTILEYSDRLLQFTLERFHPALRNQKPTGWNEEVDAPAQEDPGYLGDIDVLDTDEKAMLLRLLAKIDPTS